jgi:hypothetical protein
LLAFLLSGNILRNSRNFQKVLRVHALGSEYALL